MQTKHLCVLIHSWTKGEVGAPLNRFKPSSKVLLLTFPRRCFFCGSFMLFLSCFVMPSCTSVCWCLVVTCWEGLTSWLSFVMSIYDVVTFPLVSSVRCGAWLYRFLIFALFLTLLTGWNLLYLRQILVGSRFLSISYSYFLSPFIEGVGVRHLSRANSFSIYMVQQRHINVIQCICCMYRL